MAIINSIIETVGKIVTAIIEVFANKKSKKEENPQESGPIGIKITGTNISVKDNIVVTYTNSEKKSDK